jgi:hypothetical protein
MCARYTASVAKQHMTVSASCTSTVPLWMLGIQVVTALGIKSLSLHSHACAHSQHACTYAGRHAQLPCSDDCARGVRQAHICAELHVCGGLSLTFRAWCCRSCSAAWRYNITNRSGGCTGANGCPCIRHRPSSAAGHACTCMCMLQFWCKVLQVRRTWAHPSRLLLVGPMSVTGSLSQSLGSQPG